MDPDIEALIGAASSKESDSKTIKIKKNGPVLFLIPGADSHTGEGPRPENTIVIIIVQAPTYNSDDFMQI